MLYGQSNRSPDPEKRSTYRPLWFFFFFFLVFITWTRRSSGNFTSTFVLCLELKTKCERGDMIVVVVKVLLVTIQWWPIARVISTMTRSGGRMSYSIITALVTFPPPYSSLERDFGKSIKKIHDTNGLIYLIICRTFWFLLKYFMNVEAHISVTLLYNIISLNKN